jgi:hypothetical protein
MGLVQSLATQEISYSTTYSFINCSIYDSKYKNWSRKMLKYTVSKKLIIYMPNRKVFKEYKELFPATELSKHFDISYIFGKVVFDKDANFEQILFPQFVRTFHALLHFSLMWYRKFTTLSYRLRAFQYFGTSSDVKDTSNFLIYNGRRHSILIRLTIYFFGN